MHQISAGVRSTRNEDGGIVLDIDRGQMFRLNAVGALILESLGKGCTEPEIAWEIARQYDLSAETASTDIRAFLQTLEDHNLVRTRRLEKTS